MGTVSVDLKCSHQFFERVVWRLSFDQQIMQAGRTMQGIGVSFRIFCYLASRSGVCISPQFSVLESGLLRGESRKDCLAAQLRVSLEKCYLQSRSIEKVLSLAAGFFLYIDEENGFQDFEFIFQKGRDLLARSFPCSPRGQLHRETANVRNTRFLLQSEKIGKKTQRRENPMGARHSEMKCSKLIQSSSQSSC
jgi:hypothetical protein